MISPMLNPVTADLALRSIDKALAIAPEFAACYRLRGVCLQRSGKAEEARAALLKAKELGDPAAEKLLNDSSN